jgi:hypothetical protein
MPAVRGDIVERPACALQLLGPAIGAQLHQRFIGLSARETEAGEAVAVEVDAAQAPAIALRGIAVEQACELHNRLPGLAV